MEQLSIFDFIEDGEKYKPIKSDDWKWSFSDYPKEKNGIKVFSCFACGGGSTMGYKLAGCSVVGCCEIDEEMNRIYVSNHHPKYNFLTDIREFNKLPNDSLPGDLFDIDILDGSPPCTPFSMVGGREDTWGKEKKFREGQQEQTLDDLSFVFIETVQKLKPKVVVMENVEGLLLGNAWSYVQEIYRRLNEAGYTVHHWLLKGEYMGIPQTRHRVFFVAVRNDLGFDPRKINMSFNYAPVPYGEIKTGSGVKLNPATKEAQTLALATEDDNDIASVYERIGEKRRRFSAKICWENRVLPTIVAKLFHYRPKELETISVEDIIRAQTFPEDYDFGERKFMKVAYICGMSVPPVMIKRIVERLIESGLFDYKKGETDGKSQH